VNTNTLDKRSEARTLDSKNTTGALWLKIYLKKTTEKTALAKHAARSGHGFDWGCATFYIMQIATISAFFKNHFNLKTNIMNNKSANFPAVYHNVLT